MYYLLHGNRDDLPVAIITPTNAEMTVAEMAKIATNTAPTYTATEQAKKIAKNPLAAARDIWTETMMALAVAISRRNIKIRRPVNAISVIVPTCQIRNRYSEQILFTEKFKELLKWMPHQRQGIM